MSVAATRDDVATYVAAFREFVDDVRSGAYPEDRHIVGTDRAELHAFLAALVGEGA